LILELVLELKYGHGWGTTAQIRMFKIFGSHFLLPHKSLTISIDHRWKGFRNALSGLFCASIGSVDDRRTTSSMQAFVPEGLLPNLTHGHQLRHIALPSESVCTENLTPFIKLLPCKASSGIASLLNPHRLFGADWHGMGVHVVWLGEEGVQVRLTFQAVFDPIRHSTFHKQGRL
jgi:phosphatidylinositol glycan class T